MRDLGVGRFWRRKAEPLPAPVAPPPAGPPPWAPVVTVKATPERIQFERKYIVRLPGECRVELTAYTYSAGSSRSREHGFLYQANGRSVLFDTKRIADYIVNPVLLPFVTEAVASILAADKLYVATVGEFLDDRRRSWKLSQ